ncbi:hypothetical protein TRICI_006477 [Trichomonascus ciferrii]|uniref:DUF2423 domain-containing protein n=1 Tax=Trichomonascus ciferrii TaxID=44093 RepID=A0A642UH06_9ASCO|nr:hypothetical protein TRICI_006477 [Trichomonascus ciferrii]
MAKSLRNKKEVRNRGMLRDKVFGPVEKAREQRLAEKAKARLKQQKGEEEVEDMEVDKEETENKSKVSTSGWRGGRNDTYKKKNSTKSRKQLVFKKKMKSKK